MGIGEKLKEIRESKNLSLDDIQEETKIQKRYLRAIEDGNFHILPGSFYARAFIKEYAQALGLDDEELLETHKDELPSIGERRSEAQYTRIQRTRRSSGPSRAAAVFSFLPTVILLLLVMIIIGLAIYFIQQKSLDPEHNNEPNGLNEIYRKDNGEDEEQINNEDHNTGNEGENEEVNEEENIPEETKDLEFQVVDTNERVTPPITTYHLLHSDSELNLRIEAINKSWLDIDHDDKRIFSGFIETGNSPLEFEILDGEELTFNIGNASYVDIYINNIKLEYDIDKVQKVYQKIIVKINEEDE